MANKSMITYVQPKEKFLMIGKGIISKFSPEVIGIYCKIVNLSGGMTLSISFVAEKIKVSIKKVRKVIVQLEEEGYVVRSYMKDEHGAFIGWNYCVYAEPVSKEKRSHAGKKSDLDDNGLDQNRTSPSADKTENGKDTIIDINNNISYSNKDFIDDNKKEGIEEVPDGTQPTPEEKDFIQKMKERFPRLMRLDKPLTLEQAKKLKEKYDRDLLAKVMMDLENYKPLLKKYVSANQVISKWCQMDIERA